MESDYCALQLMLFLLLMSLFCSSLILYLQNLKKKWESCKDPEKEILQNMRRSVLVTHFGLFMLMC